MKRWCWPIIGGGLAHLKLALVASPPTLYRMPPLTFVLFLVAEINHVGSDFMSRAFVKEADGDDVLDEMPERPVSAHPNWVTPAGLRGLRAQVAQLQAQRAALAASEDMADKQRLRSVERELRYFDHRTSTAVVIEPAAQAETHVHFGSTVEVEDPDGERLVFAIVGEDEADVAAGKISWVSPLARALLESQVDDEVVWRRPVGDKALTVLAIHKGTP